MHFEKTSTLVISTLKTIILTVMVVEHIFVLLCYILVVLSELLERRKKET